MERSQQTATTAQVVLAVLAVMAALHLMKVILVPIALSLILACLLAPATRVLRRLLPLGATGAAVVLFLLMAVLGLFLASMTAESLSQAAVNLPADLERLSGLLSRRVADAVADAPLLRSVLPEPGTIDLLGDKNRRWLVENLSQRLGDLSGWVVQGLFVLVTVLFLLIEGEMLAPKVVRFFAPAPGDARAAERTLQELVRQIRTYLVARTAINLVLGLVLGLVLWLLKVKYAFALGAIVVVTNYVPYVGQLLGGLGPVLVTLAQFESMGDALIVASVYTALIGVEANIVTPVVMGRRLDLNGVTVLMACLFWGFLWGLVGLILAVPIAVCMKLIFQQVPGLYRWADLMSLSWQPPSPPNPEPNPPEPSVIEVVPALPISKPPVGPPAPRPTERAPSP